MDCVEIEESAATPEVRQAELEPALIPLLCRGARGYAHHSAAVQEVPDVGRPQRKARKRRHLAESEPQTVATSQNAFHQAIALEADKIVFYPARLIRMQIQFFLC